MQQVSKPSPDVNTLALELERAEFDGSHPELMVPNTPQAYQHPVMQAFYSAKLAEVEHDRPTLSKSRPAKHIRAVEQYCHNLTLEIQRRENLRGEGRCDGGLRRLLTVKALAFVASKDLHSLRVQDEVKKRARNVAKAKAKRDRSNKLGREFFGAFRRVSP